MMRKCTKDDLNIIQQISKQTFFETFYEDNNPETMETYLSEAFALDQLQKELENPYSSFYVYEIEGDVAGYLKLNEKDTQTEQMGESFIEIERIYVLKSFQKSGIGKIMLQKAIDLAETRAIWLGVWEKNQNAIAFYEKMGFQKTGEHVFQMGDERQIDWVMTRKH